MVGLAAIKSWARALGSAPRLPPNWRSCRRVERRKKTRRPPEKPPVTPIVYQKTPRRPFLKAEEAAAAMQVHMSTVKDARVVLERGLDRDTLLARAATPRVLQALIQPCGHSLPGRPAGLWPDWPLDPPWQPPRWRGGPQQPRWRRNREPLETAPARSGMRVIRVSSDQPKHALVAIIAQLCERSKVEAYPSACP